MLRGSSSPVACGQETPSRSSGGRLVFKIYPNHLLTSWPRASVDRGHQGNLSCWNGLLNLLAAAAVVEPRSDRPTSFKRGGLGHCP